LQTLLKKADASSDLLPPQSDPPSLRIARAPQATLVRMRSEHHIERERYSEGAQRLQSRLEEELTATRGEAATAYSHRL